MADMTKHVFIEAVMNLSGVWWVGRNVVAEVLRAAELLDAERSASCATGRAPIRSPMWERVGGL